MSATAPPRGQGRAARLGRLFAEQAIGRAQLAEYDSILSAAIANDPTLAESTIRQFYEGGGGIIRRTPEGYEVEGCPLLSAVLSEHYRITQEHKS